MRRLFALFTISLIAVSCVSGQKASKATPYQDAAEYSKKQRGLSVVIYKKGEIVFEEYHNNYSATRAHFLASGTKSFSGVMLAAAIEDGLISGFDEKVSKTIVEWKTDPRKRDITLRSLLSLTSGIDPGRSGRPPSYSDAIKKKMLEKPGSRFRYGPSPFQIFGEVMRRKISKQDKDVFAYLNRRILIPIGIKVANWRRTSGEINLPSGAFMTAKEWGKFGVFLLNEGKWNGKQIIKKKLLRELAKGSKANPNYGITFWLNKEDTPAKSGDRVDSAMRNRFSSKLPQDMYVAAGFANQRLYIIPSKEMVIVRQGRLTRFDDKKFLGLIPDLVK